MHIKKIGSLNLVFLLLTLYMNGYSQAPFNVLDSLHDNYEFISKDQIAKYGISSIKEFYRGEHYPDDTPNYFVEFKFKQRRLCQEISFDELKSNIKQAIELAYVYHYKKDKSGKFILSNRTGDAYNGYSHVDHDSYLQICIW